MTAMTTANKPFDLTSAEPSGYYIDYPEIIWSTVARRG